MGVSKIKNEAKPMGRRKRRWTREFKLSAVARMNEAEGVRALAEELGVRAELLYDWHRRYRSGGASALRSSGRPSTSGAGFELPSLPLPAPAGAEQRRIEELERKIGQQQLDLDFFRAALRHVREQRLKKGEPGGAASSR
jgi:transposase-like protein